MTPIHTLNARGNILLEVTRDYFNLTPEQVRREIQAMHGAMLGILAKKGIQYSRLRSGLTPVLNRHEAAFIFDSTVIESSWYGREVMRELLPLLEPKSTQSILCGDLIGDNQALINEILLDSLEPSRLVNFRHGTLLFAVYLNNMSEGTRRRIHASLATFPAYIGYIPADFSTRAKTYLSTCLVNAFLKNGRVVILAHEDDRSNDENINMLGYPFEDFGYRVLSLQNVHFGVFLSFKIERPVYAGFESDTEMALNAISDNVLDIKDFKVRIDPEKHGYLLSEKDGKLRKAQLVEFDRENLSELIQAKLAGNYIYNMVFLDEHDVRKFSLMIEMERQDSGHPTRLAAGFEYLPEEQVLRLITLH